VVEALVKAKASVSIKDNQGRTPLDVAKDGNHAEVLELLRVAKGDDQTDEVGRVQCGVVILSTRVTD